MATLSIGVDECSQVSKQTMGERDLDSKRVRFIIRKRFRGIAGERRLGVAWVLLDPVVTSTVYLFVFTVLRASVDGSTVFIGISLIRILQDSVMSGVNSIADFSGGIKAERVRSGVLIRSMIYFRCLDSFFHAIGTVVILFIAYGIGPIGLICFLISAQIVGILSEGLGLNIALIARKFPDIKSFVKHFLTLMFFASPALYPLSNTRGLHRAVNEFNPFTFIVEGCRYFAKRESEIFELDWRVGFFFSALLIFLTFRGYFGIDRHRWRVSTWT